MGLERLDELSHSVILALSFHVAGSPSSRYKLFVDFLEHGPQISFMFLKILLEMKE